MKRTVSMLVALLVWCAGPLHADDWPQLFGPRRDGTTQETGLVATWPKAGPTVVWQAEVGAGFSGPVVAGERLILFHRIGENEVIEALNANTGKPLWKQAYATEFADDFGKGNGPRATPVVVGARVLTLGADGWLHCLDLESGKKLWARALLQDYRVPPSYFGVGTTPVVEKDLVLVNVGAKEAGIVAFQLADGKEKWRATSDGASYASPVMATIEGKRRAIFFTRDGVVLLDPMSGAVKHRQRWRARNDASVNAATPLVVGDLAFFSASYETGALLLKLKADGAEEVWSTDEVMSNHYNTCIVRDGYLYGFDGRQESGPTLRCVELATKKIAWERPRFGCGSMILAAGRLHLLTERGDLCLIEATPAGYRELAQAHVFEAGPCRAPMALANGLLYARDGRTLKCFDLRRYPRSGK